MIKPPVVYPHFDEELGRICAWLKQHGYTMHVTLSGNVTLRKETA